MESVGDSAEHGHGRVAGSPLDRTEISQVQTGAERQLLLGHTASLSHLSDRGANDSFPSHTRIGALVIMQGLGHICPLSVLGNESHV